MAKKEIRLPAIDVRKYHLHDPEDTGQAARFKLRLGLNKRLIRSHFIIVCRVILKNKKHFAIPSSTALCSLIGLDPANYDNLSRGFSDDVPVECIVELCVQFKVSAEYMVLGKGEYFMLD